MYYQVSEYFIANEEQTTIKTNKPFLSNAVDVIVNGTKKTVDTDYTEDGLNNTIEFTSPLAQDDVVSILSTSDDYSKIISYGSKDTNNAIYKRYDSNNKLKYNNKYKVHLNIDGQEYSYSFSSVLSPMYTSSKKIFEDIGEFIDGFTEEYINSMIHRNSLEIISRVNEALEDSDAAETLYTDNAISANSNGEYETPHRLLSNWTRIKTDIDLIYARYYGISAKYGSETKTIGDISISKSIKLPYIDELLKRLKKDLEDTEQAIFGARVVSKSAVRAGNKYAFTERDTF